MKNYYIILGISPHENPDGIRQAFRNKAKKYHPDKTGQEGTSFFQDITEAYEVLSDPEKRTEYNRRLHEDEARKPAPGRSPSRTPSKPSPIDPFPRNNPFGEPFFDRDPFFNMIFGRRSHWREAREDPLEDFPQNHIDLEVILSPEEARDGFSSVLELPFSKACPVCRGAAAPEQLFFCRRCEGEGVLRQHHRVRLTLPGDIRDGGRMEIPVREETGFGVLLRLHFRIQSR